MNRVLCACGYISDHELSSVNILMMYQGNYDIFYEYRVTIVSIHSLRVDMLLGYIDNIKLFSYASHFY